MHYDSVIIGAGLSGLTCALLLARSGRKVLVLEQHPQPAPVVRGFSRDGLHFDSGFHYAGGLGDEGAFRPLFCHLGLDRKLELFPFAPQGFDHLLIAGTGETFPLPVGFAAIKSALGRKFPQVEQEINSYLDEVSVKWARFPYLDLNAADNDFKMLDVHGPSLADRLEEFSAYPQLQCLLSMHCLLYGLSPAEVSTSFHTQVAGSYYHSVHGIVGGGRALVEALLSLLADAGAEVRCQAEATSLLTTDGVVSGVQLKTGDEIQAREVVSTMNPCLLPKLLPQGLLRPAYIKRLESLRQTSSAYIVFAKSSTSLEFLRHRNLFVQQEPGLFCLDADRPLEERSFFIAAAAQGQEGDINGLIAIVPASYTEVAEWDSTEMRHSSDYLSHKEMVSARLLTLFAASCSEFEALDVVELSTPLTLSDYSLAPEGALYGVGGYLGQHNPLATTRLPGLFLSGQAIAAPGFLGTIVASYLTCGSILGHEHLRGEIKACC